MKTALAIGACILALAGASPLVAQAEDAQPHCFSTRDIRSHAFDGSDYVYFHMNNGDVYRIEAPGCATGHTRSDPLVFDPAPVGNRVCRPLDLTMRVVSPGGPHASGCIVKDIRKLTPAEISALPKRARP